MVMENCTSAIVLTTDRRCIQYLRSAQADGKQIQPYILQFGERKLSRKLFLICDQMDLHLKIITAPINQIGADFLRLATQYQCRSQAEFELGYVLMLACEAISEHRIALSSDGFRLQAYNELSQRMGKVFKKHIFDPTAHLS